MAEPRRPLTPLGEVLRVVTAHAERHGAEAILCSAAAENCRTEAAVRSFGERALLVALAEVGDSEAAFHAFAARRLEEAVALASQDSHARVGQVQEDHPLRSAGALQADSGSAEKVGPGMRSSPGFSPGPAVTSPAEESTSPIVGRGLTADAVQGPAAGESPAFIRRVHAVHHVHRPGCYASADGYCGLCQAMA